MSKFVCDNEHCIDYGVEKEYLKNVYKYQDGTLISNNAPCPECGRIRRELVNEVPLSAKNIAIANYSSASAEGKREMLKKRSHDHFEKEVKPFKEYQLHEATKQFKEVTKS